MKVTLALSFLHRADTLLTPSNILRCGNEAQDELRPADQDPKSSLYSRTVKHLGRSRRRGISVKRNHRLIKLPEVLSEKTIQLYKAIISWLAALFDDIEFGAPSFNIASHACYEQLA